jgi:hypothetical protein
MEAAAESLGLGESHDEIASLDRLMAELAATTTQPAAAGGAREEEEEDESLDALVSKYLALPPPEDNVGFPLYAAGRQHQDRSPARGEEEEGGAHKQETSPGHYWVGCTTPYFAEEAVAGLGDPLGAVVAGSHVRVVDIHQERWVVEVPPPHGASYARLRVACLAADVRACTWRRLS